MEDFAKVIFQHQIADENCGLIDIKIFSERDRIVVEQNGKNISLDRWSALELAKELLNLRDYLKVKPKARTIKELT